MLINLGQVRQSILGLNSQEMEKFWNKFGSDTEVCKQLKQVTKTSISGYNTALKLGLGSELLTIANAIADDLRSFSYEGMGMGMAMIDYTTPGKRNRVQELVDQIPTYSSMVYIGVGSAIAALNRDPQQSMEAIEPMQRWWVMDGYGFYHGLFKWKKAIDQQWVPKKITGYSQRAFDRGLGRSLWFIAPDDAEAIALKIQAFPEERRADLWSGIGVVSTYIGGSTPKTLNTIKAAASPYQSYLSLGAALAVHARYSTQHSFAQNDVACSIYCGMTTEEVAKLALELSPLNSQSHLTNHDELVLATLPIFERYREAVRLQFTFA